MYKSFYAMLLGYVSCRLSHAHFWQVLPTPLMWGMTSPGEPECSLSRTPDPMLVGRTWRAPGKNAACPVGKVNFLDVCYVLKNKISSVLVYFHTNVSSHVLFEREWRVKPPDLLRPLRPHHATSWPIMGHIGDVHFRNTLKCRQFTYYVQK